MRPEWDLKEVERRRSETTKQYKHQDDDENGADDANASMSKAIAIPTEATAEASEKENDQNDQKNRTERHGLHLHRHTFAELSTDLRQTPLLRISSVQFPSIVIPCSPISMSMPLWLSWWYR